MTRPLRTLHLWIFAVLGFVLPTVFVSGVMARRTLVPLTLPAELPVMQLKGSDYSIGFRPADDGGQRKLHLTASSYALAPDVLVYWSDSQDPDPSRAKLVGPLRAGSSYVLPGPGWTLIFYSLGHRRTLVSTPLGGRP